MADRAAIAEVAQLLRDARDRLEQANEPFDHRLGSVHARLGLLLNDLRSIPGSPRTDHPAGTGLLEEIVSRP